MTLPFDYFGQAYLPSDFDLPIVDHVHERPHPHQSLIHYLLHNKAPLKVSINQPDLDIRDDDTEYVIDIELPGVTDKSAIKIEWSSNRSLTVSGKIDRPFVACKTPATVPETNHKTKAPLGTRGKDGDWEAVAEKPQEPMLVVAERKVGPFRRHFNFPVFVAMEKLKAKLEHGLLTIRVPKMPVETESVGRVTIE